MWYPLYTRAFCICKPKISTKLTCAPFLGTIVLTAKDMEEHYGEEEVVEGHLLEEGEGGEEVLTTRDPL